MAQEIKKRADQPVETTWKLEDIYENHDQWEADFQKLKDMIPELARYDGKITSVDMFLEYMEKNLQAHHLCEYLFVYSRMRKDEDNANGTYQAMNDRARGIMVELSAATSFFLPQLARISDATLRAWADVPGLEDYRHYIGQVIREKAHVLSEAEEKLLAMAQEALHAPSSAFSMLNDADMRFPAVELEGEQIEITHANYGLLMENANRALREDTYGKLYDTYRGFANTLSALYSSNVKTGVFKAKARGFASAREAALFGKNIPVHVYDTLIHTVHESLPVMGEYLSLKKQLLGVEEMHMYDVYAHLITDADTRMDIPQARELILEALAPLGGDYRKLLERAFDERWMDYYENRGKTSGAYSWGVYGVHPYVLLNYQGTLDHVFTIAHELGHALHSYYSDQHNSYLNAGYEIFVAEVASTVNEVLLTKYILNTTQDERLKKFLLNKHLEQFRTTVFRQTMFAEFEMLAHDMAQNGEPLTVDVLCSVYAKLNAQYYPGVVQDEHISFEWARIPHFYRAFYVYQYATGFSAAVAIAQSILEAKDEQPLNDYLAFLKSGGRDYPIELLKIAGVDMTTPAPVQDSMKAFEGALQEFRTLML
ncbi:MAG: oligoendopeptidase F [Christensenellales bacterium]